MYSNARVTNGWFVTTISEKYFNPNTGERISKDEFYDTVSAAEAPSIYDIYPEDLQALVNPEDCINYDKVEFANLKMVKCWKNIVPIKMVKKLK